ncbi:MAG: hypothetical protein ACI8TX_001761 [Hyphomicrobiaceae bacterium]|jgi:hypothetical protein
MLIARVCDNIMAGGFLMKIGKDVLAVGFLPGLVFAALFGCVLLGSSTDVHAIAPCLVPGDTDTDGVCDDVDNCVNDANPGQADFDGDSLGDVCDFSIEGVDLRRLFMRRAKTRASKDRWSAAAVLPDDLVPTLLEDIAEGGVSITFSATLLGDTSLSEVHTASWPESDCLLRRNGLFVSCRSSETRARVKKLPPDSSRRNTLEGQRKRFGVA